MSAADICLRQVARETFSTLRVESDGGILQIFRSDYTLLLVFCFTIDISKVFFYASAMKVATISSKGQITIPQDIQKLLNVTHGSKVVLYPDKKMLMIKPLKHSIVEQTAGSLRKYVHPAKLGKPFSVVREEAKNIAAKILAETS